jgi:hypothetical protein
VGARAGRLGDAPDRGALGGGRAAARHVLERGGRTWTPAPHLVVATLPQQSVGSGRAAGGGIDAREDQRIGAQRGGCELFEVDGLAVAAGGAGHGRRRVDEVGAADIEVAQLVHGVFVEVGEQRGPAPGEARVQRRELFVAGAGREVGCAVLHGVGDHHPADQRQAEGAGEAE